MLSQCLQEHSPRQKCLCSPVLGGSSAVSSEVGSGGWCAWNCAEEKWIYSTWCHSMPASRSLGGEEHCPGPQQEQTLPGRADVEFVFLNSLLKVKHLQLRKSFRSASRRYFLHGSGGVGFGALQCLLIVKPKPDAPLYG